mmetsp:Transcript_11848/g.25661  ORF Transcript_11848/g.25661 Transcript_11848/m.25661 type:complete len:137 (+) Transcript_11848:1298-1708(+)
MGGQKKKKASRCGSGGGGGREEHHIYWYLFCRQCKAFLRAGRGEESTCIMRETARRGATRRILVHVQSQRVTVRRRLARTPHPPTFSTVSTTKRSEQVANSREFPSLPFRLTSPLAFSLLTANRRFRFITVDRSDR